MTYTLIEPNMSAFSYQVLLFNRAQCAPKDRADELWRRVREHSEVVEAEWATLNDVKRRDARFTISSMFSGKGGRRDANPPCSYEYLDHAAFFSGYRGSPKMIVAHLYGPDAVSRAQKYAETTGLVVHTPPNAAGSWYGPGHTTLIVYTIPGTPVAWLEDQADDR